MEKLYYVYCLLDPTKPGEYIFDKVKFEYEPFYVGKGSGNRLNEHFKTSQIKRDKNKSKVNKILKIQNSGFCPIAVKIQENLTEEDALRLEKEIIENIGRKDLRVGTLTNLTNGGENYVHWDELNIETQNRVRKILSDRMKINNPMKIKEISEKCSNSKKGMKFSEEYKKNMSLIIKNSTNHKSGVGSLKNRDTHKKIQEKNMKPVIQYDKNMNYIKEYESIKEASRQLNIRKGDISSVLHDRQKTTSGFIFKFKGI